MFSKLDGLPLAIAQAGAYLQQSGVGIEKYLEFYEQQWKELMDSEGPSHAPLQEYLNGSVGTTWNISYKAIREKDEAAANLLLLWAFLDNRDLWHGLFVAACRASPLAAMRLSELIGNIASNELEFTKAIQVLRNYSLIEDVEDLASYATHPVVHRWAYHFLGEDSRVKLAQLAVVTVGWSVPHESTWDCLAMKRRLLRHAQACSRWVSMGEITENIRSHEKDEVDFNRNKEKKTVLDAIHLLGLLYQNQGKMAEAEKMYQRALEGYEKAWGPKHTSTLITVNNLGNLYANQGKIIEAEKMYQRALKGYEKAWGPEHTSTLDTVNNLSVLYAKQGKITKAEKMYQRALKGYEKALGPEHTSTLNTVNNFGILYKDQGKMAEAEKMYQRALEGYEKALGPEHTSTLNTVNNLGLLYVNQGKITEAKKMYQRALKGYEKAFGSEHTSTLDTVNNLGLLYVNQGKITEAEKMYQRALRGYEKALGPNHMSTLNALNIINNLGLLYADQGKHIEAEEMYQRALNEYEKTWGRDNPSTLRTLNNLKLLSASRGEHTKVEEIDSYALDQSDKAHNTKKHLQSPSSTARAVLHRLKADIWRRKRDT